MTMIPREADAAGRPAAPSRAYGRQLAIRVYLQQATALVVKHTYVLLSSIGLFSRPVVCHHRQVQVLLKVAFPCNSLLHAQVIICNARSNFSPAQQRAQETSPSLPSAIFLEDKAKAQAGNSESVFSSN